MNRRLTTAAIPVAFILLWTLLACGRPAPATEATAASEPDYLIVPGERIGRITADNCSREAVLAAYGDEARVEEIYLGEGIAEEGVVVYPDNPRNRLEIYWDAAFDATRPAFLRIRGDGGTDWKTEGGLSIGTPIKEVERLNGRPFELYGFGWDYGGLVTDWKGGAFDGGLGLGFELTNEEETPVDVLGETILRSDDPTLRRLGPVVTVLELRFR